MKFRNLRKIHQKKDKFFSIFETLYLDISTERLTDCDDDYRYTVEHQSVRHF